MTNDIKRFWRDESGAVTVDWVVLTAGIIAFGVLVVGSILNGATATGSGAGDRLANAEVPTVQWTAD